jgi:hypothetical protein
MPMTEEADVTGSDRGRGDDDDGKRNERAM